MGFISTGTVDDLPAVTRAPKAVNREAIDALHAIVSAQAGATASDGILYTGDKAKVKASGEAGKAKRMLVHVLTDPTTIKTRVYAEGTGFRWAVWLVPAEIAELPEDNAPSE